jgi:uncharacterized coiled-coil protein SlyX
MNDAVSQRFERVEAPVAHLERQVEQLNEVLIDQGRQIEQLKKLVQRQATTLEAIELERIKASNPRPPHH